VIISLILGSVAYAMAAAALVVRDILWLRVLGAAANIGFVISNLVAPGGPTYVFLFWSVLFLSINFVQIGSLMAERRNIRLGDEDRDVHDLVFPNLSVGEFRILVKAGCRRDLPSGRVLVEQGRASAEVLLIERGAVRLERDGQPLDRLVEGHMLGEIAFVAHRPFSSRAIVDAPTRVIAWERTTLDRLFLRRPSLALGFHAAFIGQLRGGPVRLPNPAPVANGGVPAAL
jgi:hypothetical protein